MARNHICGVRLEEDQWGQFERAAKATGKSVSKWLRDLGAAAVAGPTIQISSILDPNKWEPNFGTVVAPESWAKFEAAAKAEGIKIEDWIVQACEAQWRIGYGLVVGRGFFRVEDLADCKNPERPVGCPDSHALEMGEMTITEEMPIAEAQARWPNTPMPKRTASDIAASIPGLSVGLVDSSKVPTAVASLEFVHSLLRFEEGDANEKLLERTRGEIPPSKFRSWYVDRKVQVKLAEWLDANYPEMGW